VFDSQKQTLLRQLKGHQRPAHTTRFAPDKMHVLSGSDDATVSLKNVLQDPKVPQMQMYQGAAERVHCC